MSQQQQEAFTAAIRDRRSPNTWVSIGSRLNTDFSNCGCDSCGSTFAGDMSQAFECSRVNGIFQGIEIEICIDCVQYHANDELPETWHQTPHDLQEYKLS